MDLKKLYALLVILIVIYIGINVSVNGFNILNDNSTQTTDNDDGIDIESVKLENFTQTKVNSSAVKYVNNATGVNIELQAIDNSLNLSNLYNSLSNQSSYTSSQKINQNGVTAYFLYNEGKSTYDTDIYFNKNNQNFKISGYNTTYENSDFFINNCKHIIDTIGSNSASAGKIDIGR